MNYFKEIQKFALPLIANNFLQLLINQLILFLAVNQSVENLAGITTIQSLLYALGGILGAVALAFNIEGGQTLGKHDDKGFLQLIKSSLWLNTFVGVGFALLTVVIGRVFLSVTYNFQGAMLETATWYLLIQAPYILLTLMMFLSSNLIKIENKTSYIMGISLISTSTEIGLNLLLVRILKMGIIGASLSSTLSLLLLVILQFCVVRRQVLTALRENAVKIKQLLQKSLPLCGQELLEGVIFTIVFEALIARLGVTTLAIYGLCAQALNIVKMPTYMYENALTIFGSKAYGEQNFEKIQKTLKITFSSSIFFYLGFSAIILLNARRFANLFSSKVAENFQSYLFIALIFSIFFGLYENLKGILQAVNLEKYVLKRTFIVNLLMFILMIGSKLIGIVNFELLYVLYGASLLVLGVIFLRKYLSKISSHPVHL